MSNSSRVLSYPEGYSPSEIGNIPEERMKPYEMRELVKKIIKRQMVEYHAGFFTKNPKSYHRNILTRPYSESPSEPNVLANVTVASEERQPTNYLNALETAYNNNLSNVTPPVPQEMDRNDTVNATLTETICIPMVYPEVVPENDANIYIEPQVIDQYNDTDNEYNLRVEQDNWLYNNINYVNKIEIVCSQGFKCCLSITITGLLFGTLGAVGGKRIKSFRKKRKSSKKRKTKRKSLKKRRKTKRTTK